MTDTRYCIFCGTELNPNHPYNVCKPCFADAERKFRELYPEYANAYQTYIRYKNIVKDMTYNQVLKDKGLTPNE